MQVVRAKFQQITVKEFLPTLGIREGDLRSWRPRLRQPDVAIEFMIAYRFGHDIIPDRVRQPLNQ